MISLAGQGRTMPLRDMRLGFCLHNYEVSKVRRGIADHIVPIRIDAIYTEQTHNQFVAEVNGVVCSDSQLFLTPEGWAAPNPQSYRIHCLGRQFSLKGNRGMFFPTCEFASEGELPRLEAGMQILDSDGVWRKVEYVQHHKGERQDMIGLMVDVGDYYFADGYAVASVA
jgi:hypothetical protein